MCGSFHSMFIVFAFLSAIVCLHVLFLMVLVFCLSSCDLRLLISPGVSFFLKQYLFFALFLLYT